MGLLLGIFAPFSAGLPRGVDEPDGVPAAAGPVDAVLAAMAGCSRRRRTSRSNWPYDARPTRTWPGSTSAMCSPSSAAAERVHAATIRRFTERFARFDLPDKVLRPSYGLAEATLYVASPPPGQPPTTVRFDYEKLSAGHAERCGTEGGTELVSYGRRGHRRCASSTPRPGGESGRQGRRDLGARGQHCRRLLAKPQATEHTFGGMLVDPSPGTPPGSVVAHRRPGRSCPTVSCSSSAASRIS